MLERRSLMVFGIVKTMKRSLKALEQMLQLLQASCHVLLMLPVGFTIDSGMPEAWPADPMLDRFCHQM